MASRIPVIVISGRGLEEDIIQAFDAGAADYLTKPFRTGELLARMRARLRAATPVPMPHIAVDDAEAIKAATPATWQTAPVPQKANLRRQLGEDEDAPVFMPLGEEQRLMTGIERESVDDMNPADLAHLSLGARLRASRQRRRITLVQAELESRVRMQYIQAMEEEKFALLPRGPITEELLRSYASYIGVDVNAALDEYRRLHFNAPIEPLTALGGTPLPRTIPRWLVRLLAVVLALIVGIGGIWLWDPDAITAAIQWINTTAVWLFDQVNLWLWGAPTPTE